MQFITINSISCVASKYINFSGVNAYRFMSIAQAIEQIQFAQDEQSEAGEFEIRVHCQIQALLYLVGIRCCTNLKSSARNLDSFLTCSLNLTQTVTY